MNYQDLRQRLTEKKSVYSKKIGKVPVEVYKVGSKFDAYVDGDKLDTYKSEKEAIEMAKEFVKELS